MSNSSPGMILEIFHKVIFTMLINTGAMEYGTVVKIEVDAFQSLSEFTNRFLNCR